VLKLAGGVTAASYGNGRVCERLRNAAQPEALDEKAVREFALYRAELRTGFGPPRRDLNPRHRSPKDNPDQTTQQKQRRMKSAQGFRRSPMSLSTVCLARWPAKCGVGFEPTLPDYKAVTLNERPD